MMKTPTPNRFLLPRAHSLDACARAKLGRQQALDPDADDAHTTVAVSHRRTFLPHTHHLLDDLTNRTAPAVGRAPIGHIARTLDRRNPRAPARPSPSLPPPHSLLGRRFLHGHGLRRTHRDSTRLYANILQAPALSSPTHRKRTHSHTLYSKYLLPPSHISLLRCFFSLPWLFSVQSHSNTGAKFPSPHLRYRASCISRAIFQVLVVACIINQQVVAHLPSAAIEV